MPKTIEKLKAWEEWAERYLKSMDGGKTWGDSGKIAWGYIGQEPFHSFIRKLKKDGRLVCKKP